MITNKKAGWLTNIWKSHLSGKWDYSSIKYLLKKFRETFSMGRTYGSEWISIVYMKENMDLIEELV